MYNFIAEAAIFVTISVLRRSKETDGQVMRKIKM